MRNVTLLSFILVSLFFTPVGAQSLTFVELNCENLFDYKHDSLKQDQEYLPESIRRWTRQRYWKKLNNIGRELVSTCDDGVPDLIALCEVENDSVMVDLCRRSLLRTAGYDYGMTQSPDQRGVDVALMYQPMSFAPDTAYGLRVEPVSGMRPTRDILYVRGRIIGGDTLHVFVVHAPSRYGGEHYSRRFRQTVIERLCCSLDSLSDVSSELNIIIAGDFNDDADSPVLKLLEQHGVANMTRHAIGQNGALGTYRYQGEWGSLDHIFGSPAIQRRLQSAYIHSPRFLLEKDKQHGGWQPLRTYNGLKYQPGYSDHLPLVMRLEVRGER